MQIDIHDDKKLVCIWFTIEEWADDAIQEQLKPLYKEYKKKKYMVALYCSGKQDLSELTCALLRHNRKLFAELEVREEKQSAAL